MYLRKALTSICLTVIVMNTVAADCPMAEPVAASYRVSFSYADREKMDVHRLLLWRNDLVVAHQYPDRGITELWEKTSQQSRLRLVRLFDHHQRGIEYQPAEINNGRGENDWSLKYQLISDRLKSSMELYKSNGQGCDRLEHYRTNVGGQYIELLWLPHQQLVKRLTVKKGAQTRQWQLMQVERDDDRVKQVFARLSSYQMTDYTDIGDNESDPFLMKMIHLGFVEHGSSGFYSADGHVIDDRQHHH